MILAFFSVGHELLVDLVSGPTNTQILRLDLLHDLIHGRLLSISDISSRGEVFFVFVA